jgi:hypothetical protein
MMGIKSDCYIVGSDKRRLSGSSPRTIIYIETAFSNFSISILSTDVTYTVYEASLSRRVDFNMETQQGI